MPAKKNALNSRTKGITTTDQSKVMFDEMVGDTNKTEKVKRATPTVVPEKENRPISSKVTQKSNKMLDNNKEATSQVITNSKMVNSAILYNFWDTYRATNSFIITVQIPPGGGGHNSGKFAE